MGKKKHNSVIYTTSDELNTAVDTEAAESSVRPKYRRPLTVIVMISVLLVMTFICGVGTAYSWFSPGQEADLEVAATSFSVETLYSVSNSTFSTLNDTVNINVSNLNSLKLRIDYTGYSAAYIRVQLFESFRDADGKLIASSDINYTLDDKWNWVEKDGYYYLKDIVMQPQNSEEPLSIGLCTRASLGGATYPSGSYLNLVSVVEAVQPDRFDEFFGVSYEEVFGTENN